MPTESEKNIENFTKSNFEDEKYVSGGLNWSHALFLFVSVVSTIMLFSAMVYYMMKRKRVNQLRHRLVPLYHFDPGECEDWEEEITEESTNEKIPPSLTREPSPPRIGAVVAQQSANGDPEPKEKKGKQEERRRNHEWWSGRKGPRN